MNQQKWERDIINRQRNIVFPDTVLNEGRFYRNIFSGKAQLNTTQRIGILLIAATFFLLGCFGLADPVRSLLTPNGGYIHAADVIFGVFWLGVLLCGIAFAMKAILSNPDPVRKRRRGYRQSSKA
ncbi:MAG: hypothetical protein ACXV5J_14640 [Candidatus Angelobacter sp.]